MENVLRISDDERSGLWFTETDARYSLPVLMPNVKWFGIPMWTNTDNFEKATLEYDE